VLVGTTSDRIGGSHYLRIGGDGGAGVDELPVVDLEQGPRLAAAVASAIRAGLVRSAHDASEGGLLVAAIEMAFSGGLGVEVDLDAVPVEPGRQAGPVARAFAEDPSRYLLEVAASDLDAIADMFGDLPHAVIGTFTAPGPDGGEISIAGADATAADRADRFLAAWNEGADR
jgi:phosphoribosylformylglycinamidine synthase